VDVAWLFKMYHCLEMRKKGAGWSTLAAVPARQCVVTLPKLSLAGRQTDIVGMHAPELTARCAAKGWPVERLDLGSEIGFVITKCVGPR
jgi:16S rRNA (guanine(1405)-N(7))-methyltransferase